MSAAEPPRAAGKVALVLALLAGGIAMAGAPAAPAAMFTSVFTAFPVTIDSPYGSIIEVARGPEHSIWVIEESALTPRFVRLSSQGVVTGEFPVPTGTQGDLPESSFPQAPTLGPDGNMWFTDDGLGGEGKGFVGRVSPAGKITEFPIKAPGASRPAGIAVGPDGNLWFAEQLRGSIGRIDPTGAFLGEFVLPSSVAQGQSEPTSIALGPDGNMWFTDENSAEEQFIGKLTPLGAASGFRVALPQYSRLDAIAPGPDGNVWFTAGDFVSYRTPTAFIGRITSSGSITLFALPTIDGALPGLSTALTGIVAGSDGNLWFTEQGAGVTLGRVKPSGAIDSFVISTAKGNPGGVALGDDGAIWFTDGFTEEANGAYLNHVWRFAPPRAPTSTQPPSLSGQAVVGQILSVSEGSWANDYTNLTYRWQSCNAGGGECADLPGGAGSTLLLTDADVDRRLRAVVTASGAGGTTSVASEVSPAVLPAPPGPSRIVADPGSPPVVAATMTWRFRWSRSSTLLQSLVAHTLPAGGSLLATCRGGGCAFARRHATVAAPARACASTRCKAHSPRLAPGELDLTKWFRRRRLRVGTRISVSITRPGWLGKEYRFTIRAAHAPSVEVACLAAAARGAHRGC